MNVKSYLLLQGSMDQPAQDISVYSRAIIARSVPIDVLHVGSDIAEVIRDKVATEIEGKCVVEGFVRPGSVKVETYSAGLLEGQTVVYQVGIACDVCAPVEGEQISCVARNVTKAGVRAEIDVTPSPVTVFLARDHHLRSKAFSTISPNDRITVSVIGQRFELNDPYVSVIASLVENERDRKQPMPRIAIGEEVS